MRRPPCEAGFSLILGGPGRGQELLEAQATDIRLSDRSHFGSGGVRGQGPGPGDPSLLQKKAVLIKCERVTANLAVP